MGGVVAESDVCSRLAVAAEQRCDGRRFNDDDDSDRADRVHTPHSRRDNAGDRGAELRWHWHLQPQRRIRELGWDRIGSDRIGSDRTNAISARANAAAIQPTRHPPPRSTHRSATQRSLHSRPASAARLLNVLDQRSLTIDSATLSAHRDICRYWPVTVRCTPLLSHLACLSPSQQRPAPVPAAQRCRCPRADIASTRTAPSSSARGPLHCPA